MPRVLLSVGLLGAVAQPAHAQAPARDPAQALTLAQHAPWGNSSRARPPLPKARVAIVGGTGATQGAFGYMAFVLHSDAANHPNFSCTGTLLSSNVVLTAGHCAVDEATGTQIGPDGFTIVTGSVDWSDKANRLLSDVSSVHVYPSYDPASGQGDAALLVLSQPTTAPSVRLATSADTNLVQVGTSALVAGWGSTSAGSLPTTVVQWGSTVVQRPGYCALHEASFNGSAEICAVDYPTFAAGICNGDSGGPLIASGSANEPVQIGIASRTSLDCSTSDPDYFTRVDSISTWANAWTASVAAAPALTMSDARSYAAQLVKQRTHKRPRLSFNCTQINWSAVHCSLAWLTGSTAYKATGKFWHYLSNGTAYWTYDFRGTRSSRTCVTRHQSSYCTTHHQRFHWY